MLCKIWGFHGSDYEERHLLGFKNPVLTSQETHYVSATESSQLMLCKIWGIHGSDYEECRILGCYAEWFLEESHGVICKKTTFFAVIWLSYNSERADQLGAGREQLIGCGLDTLGATVQVPESPEFSLRAIQTYSGVIS
jgi:hypothetical protein